MAGITPAMANAIRTLRDHTGEGAIDKYGRVVAAGEILQVDAATWLRLMTLGLLEPAGELRVRLTEAGFAHD